MAFKFLIILGVLWVTCLALPTTDVSEGTTTPKGFCMNDIGEEGRCVPYNLCKPDSSGNVEIRHPITPACGHFYDICCLTERVIQWMPPESVP